MKFPARRKAAALHKICAFSCARKRWLTGSLLLAVMLWAAWVIYATPGLAPGWEYEVYADGLDEVSALVLDGQGGMYVTLEKRHGQGQLIHLTKGTRVMLLDGMDKPDGIQRRGQSLYLTNESGTHGLLEYHRGAVRYIDGVVGGEGIALAGADQLLVIEDRKTQGRLLRIDEHSGSIEVLLDGLNEAEGVCQTSDGDIYFVEKTANRLSRYSNGQVSVAYEGLIKPAFLNCMDDGTILITEDRTNFGRLLRYHAGTLSVLATRLHSPQTVIAGNDGDLYLAEQRSNRILRIYRPDH